MFTPPTNVLLPIDYWAWANRKPDSGKYAPKHISSLKSNEVFVFGANKNGFHGAGSAGWAYTGKIGNQYREGNPLLKQPIGTRGFWAVLGVGMGYQIGEKGRSYAICTILNPGNKRSVDLELIKQQVKTLYIFASFNYELTFFVTRSGTLDRPSLNGYYLGENASCYLDKNGI